MRIATLDITGEWSLDQADEVIIQQAPTLIDSNELVRAHAANVIRRCTFLVNGSAESDRSRIVTAADRVDVLPPFAGG